jgi:hypothetical protein
MIDNPNSKAIPDNVAQAASLWQIARRSVVQKIRILTNSATVGNESPFYDEDGFRAKTREIE